MHYDMSKKQNTIELKLSSFLNKIERLVWGSRLALDNVEFAASAQM